MPKDAKETWNTAEVGHQAFLWADKDKSYWFVFLFKVMAATLHDPENKIIDKNGKTWKAASPAIWLYHALSIF